MRYYLAVSLAPQPELCTAVVVQQLPTQGQPRYRVRSTRVWVRGTPITSMIQQVEATLYGTEVRGQCDLLIEAPVECRSWVEEFQGAGLDAVAMELHGEATQPTHQGCNWTAPLLQIAGAPEPLLQTRRLEFNAELDELATLLKEMEALRELRPGAPLRRVPLATCVALCCWWGQLGERGFPSSLSLATMERGTTQRRPWG